MSKRSKKPSKSSRDEPQPAVVRAAFGGPPAWATAIVLAVTICAVYVPALDVPFIFDDSGAIVRNESITSLWPLIGTSGRNGPLNAATDLPTCGRPLVNLSFAVNYFFGGVDPRGYHAVNVAIHFLSAMLVWSILRRSLRLPFFNGRFDASAGWLALAAAMLWALHPLVTEAVIYTTQRTELMMALFYLATLYCSLRYWSELPLPPREACRELGRTGPGEGSLKTSPNPHHRALWLTLAILASLAGMASKEVMVSAPLMVLLFERTFIAGSLASALRRSWRLYAGLACTWIPLLLLSLQAPHGPSAGFGLGIPGYVWWLTQSKALLLYLKLAIWPWPLLIHYQWEWLTSFAQAWMYVVPVALLGIGTLILLWLNKPVGYLGIWVFAILAPTSVIPIPLEMAAERRMYLPLVAIVTLFIIGGYTLTMNALHRWNRNRQQPSAFSRSRIVPAISVLLIAIVFGLVSNQRLTAYNDATYLWQEVLRYQPRDFLAHTNLGILFAKSDRVPEAIHEYRTAIELNPKYLPARSNLGVVLTNSGRATEAVDVLHEALALDPTDHAVLDNLCIALMQAGRFSEAIEPLQHAAQLTPDDVEARNKLGNALNQLGRFQEAIVQFEAALALHPDDAVVLNNLGIALIYSKRFPEAIEKLQRAIELNPDYGDAHNDLGLALFHSGQIPDAIGHYRRAIELNSNDANAHYNWGNALQKTGQPQDAIEHYQAAVRANTNFLQAYISLIEVFTLANRPSDAIATAKRATEVGRATGQQATVELLEGWLQDYQAELRQIENAAPNSQTNPSAK